MIGEANNKTNFPHKLLVTDRQVSKLHKAFTNTSSANMKLSKAHLSKIVQSRRFLARLLEPLIKVGLTFMKNVLKPLTKSVLIPLALTPAASAADAEIH